MTTNLVNPVGLNSGWPSCIFGLVLLFNHHVGEEELLRGPDGEEGGRVGQQGGVGERCQEPQP